MVIHSEIYLHHITHLNNLEQIIKNDGLVCYNQIQKNKITYTNIANNNIQSNRSNKDIPCNPFGVLHDYVPFYFCRKSPMLYALFKNNVQGYNDGQEPIIYLIIKIKKILDDKLHYVFTDGHAIMDLTNFYNDIKCLSEVNFDIINATYWFDTDEYPDRCRQRQAEFLIHEHCPWKQLIGIATKTADTKNQVLKILENKNLQNQINVAICENWYYR